MADPPQPSPERPPPGWYPDPATPGGQRWWDGDAWSDDTKGGTPPTIAAPEEQSHSSIPPSGRYPAAPESSDLPTPDSRYPAAPPGASEVPVSDSRYPAAPPGASEVPVSDSRYPAAPPGISEVPVSDSRNPAGTQTSGPPAGFDFPPPPVQTKGPIRELGPWMSESFRLAVDRAGHFLPMVLIFVLSVGLFNSVALWFGLENSTLTIDSDSGDTDWVYGGSSTWLLMAALTIPISAVLTAMAKAAITRQAWASQAGNPEPWSVSVNGALARSRRVITVALGRSVIYWGSATLLLLAVVVNPGLSLFGPVVIVGLLAVWVGLCFIGTTAALSGPEHGAYRTSLRLVRVQLGPLIGRLILLALIAGSMILAFGLLGAPFTAIVGGGAETAVEFGAETVRSQDILGQNVSVFALGSVFSALGLGANHVLTTVGTALLYRNLGGPVGADAPGSQADGGLTLQAQ